MEEKPSFLKKCGLWLWRFIKGYLMAIGLMVTVLSLLLMLSLSKLSTSTPRFSAPTKGILKIHLRGEIAEDSLDFSEILWSRVTGRRLPISLADVQVALRRVAQDPDVAAVAIVLDQARLSAAMAAELRRQIVEVRESGKKVHVWASSLDTYSYYLASAGDRLVLPDAAGMLTLGPVFQMTYFGDALRKIGIDVEVIRAGKFKSAFESFIQNDPSPESLVAYKAVEESTRAQMVEDVAASRQRTSDEVRRWFKQSIYSAGESKTEGMIDELAFIDEFEEKLLSEQAENFQSFIKLKTYLRQSEAIDEKRMAKDESAIGMIVVDGTIVMSANEDGSSGETDPESLREQVEWMIDEDSVKSVVLRINSPGGSAEASDYMWRDIQRLAAKKPVIVSFADVAASGGYYIATAGTRILSEPTTITGSIGVIGALPNVSAFREKYGVSFHVVTQSDRAAMLNPGQKSTAFDKAILENQIDMTYQRFLERVAAGRKMTTEQVHELAQGRIYSGRQALELKLVDDLGGLKDAVTEAKKAAGLDPQKLYALATYEPEHSLESCLTNISQLPSCLEEMDSRFQMRSAPVFPLQSLEHALLRGQYIWALAPIDIGTTQLRKLLLQ